MPTYDFRCRACEIVFEAQVPVSTTAPCPACGSEDVERCWTPVHVYRGPGMRGYAARRSNTQRKDREEKRWDGFRQQREEQGLPPRGPSPD